MSATHTLAQHRFRHAGRTAVDVRLITAAAILVALAVLGLALALLLSTEAAHGPTSVLGPTA
jgi:hypothetical protein